MVREFPLLNRGFGGTSTLSIPKYHPEVSSLSIIPKYISPLESAVATVDASEVVARFDFSKQKGSTRRLYTTFVKVEQVHIVDGTNLAN